MQVTFWELLHEVKEYLLAPRALVINTNLAAILITAACIGYLLYAAGKYLNWNNHKKACKKRHPDRKWYPTGWIWNDEKQLWEPPDFIKK